MARYNISFSKNFRRKAKKLSSVDRETVQDKILILEDNPSHPSLRTKPLHKKPLRYESSVNMDIRLVWRYEDGNKTITLLDVGHHDILKKY